VTCRIAEVSNADKLTALFKKASPIVVTDVNPEASMLVSFGQFARNSFSMLVTDVSPAEWKDISETQP
jgi:hypothetical protein